MEEMKAFGVIPDVTFLNVFIKKRQFRRDNSGAQVGIEPYSKFHLAFLINNFFFMLGSIKLLSGISALSEHNDVWGSCNGMSFFSRSRCVDERHGNCRIQVLTIFGP